MYWRTLEGLACFTRRRSQPDLKVSLSRQFSGEVWNKQKHWLCRSLNNSLKEGDGTHFRYVFMNIVPGYLFIGFQTSDFRDWWLSLKISQLGQIYCLYVRSSMASWLLALCPNPKDLSCVLYGRWFSVRCPVILLPLRPASLTKKSEKITKDAK